MTISVKVPVNYTAAELLSIKRRGQTVEHRRDGGAAHFAKHNTNPRLKMRIVVQVRQRRRYVKRCRLAIIVSSYVILKLGMSMGQLIIVMNALEARDVNSPPWVSYDPSNPVWNTHANNKVTIWKLQSLVQPLHRHRRKWMGWLNGVYFFSPEMELARSERCVSMAYDIGFSGS